MPPLFTTLAESGALECGLLQCSPQLFLQPHQGSSRHASVVSGGVIHLGSQLPGLLRSIPICLVMGGRDSMVQDLFSCVPLLCGSI